MLSNPENCTLLLLPQFAICHEQFSGRRIIEAKSRSRAAGQFGAQADEASNRLTRRPATHHHAPDSRARPHATADWLRTFGRMTPEISWRHTQRMTCDQTWQQSAEQGAQQSWHDAWHLTQRRTPHLGWRQRAHRTQQVTQLLRRTARCTESLI